RTSLQDLLESVGLRIAACASAQGRVAKVEMTTLMALICKVLVPSISTFETPPRMGVDRVPSPITTLALRQLLFVNLGVGWLRTAYRGLSAVATLQDRPQWHDWWYRCLGAGRDSPSHRARVRLRRVPLGALPHHVAERQRRYDHEYRADRRAQREHGLS